MDLFVYLQSATATTIYSADYLQISWYLCIPLSIGPTCRDTNCPVQRPIELFGTGQYRGIYRYLIRTA